MFMNLQKAGDAKDEKEVALRLLNYSDYVIEGKGGDKAVGGEAVSGRGGPTPRGASPSEGGGGGREGPTPRGN